MNYVTVSIPLLLVLAGFNHAHGLTTFGKSPSNTQNAQLPAAQGKPCTVQANCTLIKGTTCLKGFCLCGDNTNPVNGKCDAAFKAPRHICEKDDDCVNNADCVPPKDLAKPNNTPNNSNNNSVGYKTCQCADGFIDVGTKCSGGTKFVGISPSLLITLIAVFFKILK